MPRYDRVIALVLAFGQGRRLMPLTADRASSAVPFGGTYRLIDFALSNLVNGRISQIAVLTQYKSHSLNRHIAQAWQLSPMVGDRVTVVPAQMRTGPDWYAGSADAVYQNLHLIRETCPDHVFVLPSDAVCRLDPRQLLDEHRASGAGATVAATRVPAGRATGSDVLDVDRLGRVASVWSPSDDPRQPADAAGETFASTGICVFHTGALVEAVTRDASNRSSGHDLGGTVLRAMAERGEVAVYDLARNEVPGAAPHERGQWRSVSDLDSYYAASMDLVARRPQFNLFNRHWPIYGWQPQPLPPAVFGLDGMGRPCEVVECLVSPGVAVAGGSVRRSILSPDVVVSESAVVEDCVLMNRVEVGRGAVLCRAIVDKDVRIPAGFTMGLDGPPDPRRYHVSPGGVVAIAKRQTIEPPVTAAVS